MNTGKEIMNDTFKQSQNFGIFIRFSEYTSEGALFARGFDRTIPDLPNEPFFKKKKCKVSC